MQRILEAVLPRVRAGWVLPLALLALPGCAEIIGLQPFDPGTDNGNPPKTSVIFCDIIDPLSGRHCASPMEIGMGIRIEEAATALVTGQRNPTALDYSQSSQDKCGVGVPEAISFKGDFPDGFPACLNCSQIGSKYSNPTAFCVSTCNDLTDGNLGFCATAGIVKTSTNFAPEPDACFKDACDEEGTFGDFDDPRRHPEPVDWQDAVNTTVIVTSDGGTLEKNAGDGTQFDAGADGADQTITHGSAYVEFTANGNITTRLCGFTEGETGDTTTDYTQINFALDLFKDGHIYVYELGAKAQGPDTDPLTQFSFGPYSDREVFRVTVKDNLDGTGKFAPMGGTATVTYTRLTGSCVDGQECAEEVLYPSRFIAHYPLRVDSSLLEIGARLENVRLVRIR